MYVNIGILVAFAAVVSIEAAPSTTLTSDSSMSSAPQSPPVVDLATVPITERALHTPPLHEVVEVLSRGLAASFAEVSVSEVDCPDLTQEPYGLTSPGLCGGPKLVELGGVPYLVPLVQRGRLYCLRALLQRLRPEGGLLAGAGAGPWPHVGANCEGVVNLSVRNGSVVQGSRAAWVHPVGAAPADAQYRLQLLPPTETRAALLGNYLLSDGQPGKVIKIVANNRTGESNFITAIRETLQNHYKDKVVGLGGVFVLRGSPAWYHVMPDFSPTPLTSDQDVERWLHFLPAPPATTTLGTLVTGDLGLDLRLQHFHGWGSEVGGHYHRDTEPSAARYEAYLVLARAVVRVDRPQETHGFGRD